MNTLALCEGLKPRLSPWFTDPTRIILEMSIEIGRNRCYRQRFRPAVSKQNPW